MKKKSIAGPAILIAACCSLAGCSLSLGGEKEGDDYAFLNEMLKGSYSQIVLTVENDFDGDTLTSRYTIAYGESITVTYTVEEFALLSSAEEIVTKSGKVTIAGGEVISTEGDDIGISADVATLPFEFKESYFENAELGGNFFNADVEDAVGFLGRQIVCTEMTVQANFGDGFSSLTIGYRASADERVKATYTFTK